MVLDDEDFAGGLLDGMTEDVIDPTLPEDGEDEEFSEEIEEE